MRERQHTYAPTVEWTGNLGTGTSGYRDYSRAHEVHHEGKPSIVGSSDAAFRGDPARWNPEELLVAALAQCHMLMFLHLAADSGVRVTRYTDTPTGIMQETADGGGHFESVVLRPSATITADSDASRLDALHARAHHLCFLANSVSFPVTHETSTTTAARGGE